MGWSLPSKAHALFWHETCCRKPVSHDPPTSAEALGPEPSPMQRVVKVRRDYNNWVASETMEDYALRFTPQRFRRWSEWRVANTAFGAASFLILEAVGATLARFHRFGAHHPDLNADNLEKIEVIALSGLEIDMIDNLEI
jgi:hypothetical protein